MLLCVYKPITYFCFFTVVKKSFISSKCVIRFGLELSLLTPLMTVATTIGGGLIVKLVCKSCPITVSNKTYFIDLMCLPLREFNVILGMDWLSSNSVYIWWEEKTSYMPTKNTTEGVTLSALLNIAHQMI